MFLRPYSFHQLAQTCFRILPTDNKVQVSTYQILIVSVLNYTVIPFKELIVVSKMYFHNCKIKANSVSYKIDSNFNSSLKQDYTLGSPTGSFIPLGMISREIEMISNWNVCSLQSAFYPWSAVYVLHCPLFLKFWEMLFHVAIEIYRNANWIFLPNGKHPRISNFAFYINCFLPS